MSREPDLKTIMKPLCWFIVLTGWLLYGFLIWVQFEHPHPERDPITDFQEGLKDANEHWGFSLFMLSGIILYMVSWAYIKAEREDKKQQQKDKQNETRQQRRAGD
jgi:hypothetical protein